MTPVIVLGPRVRRVRGLPASLPVVSLSGFLTAPRGVARALVVGSTGDVADVARAAGDLPIAFAGSPELCRLFAVDRSIGSALGRLEGGTEYRVDLGIVARGGARHAFLGTVTAGAGAAGGFGFPWAGRRGAISITGERTSITGAARAVVVANAQHWRRWTVAPRAAMNDGLLEIQAFGGSVVRLWGFRRALTLGLHTRHPGVDRLATAAADVLVPASWQVFRDGIPAGRGPFGVHLEVNAATLLI